MISETLSVGLEKYQIGPKLRRLRLRKKLGLTELGRHTGLSAGMLSKIERGLLFPTLPTLLRIALVFNTGLEHFFSNEEAGPQIAVVRKNQRLKFPNPPGGKPPAYFFESLDFPITGSKIAAFYAEFTSDRLVSDPHSHEGAELIYQLRGKLRVIVGVVAEAIFVTVVPLARVKGIVLQVLPYIGFECPIVRGFQTGWRSRLSQWNNVKID